MSDETVMVTVLLATALPFALLARVLLVAGGPVMLVVWALLGAGLAAFFTGSWWAAAGAVFLAAFVAHDARQQRRAQRLSAAAVIQRHANELGIRRRQLVHARAYGVIDRSAWDRELDAFMGQVLQPAVRGLSPLSPGWGEIRADVERAASEAQLHATFDAWGSPIDYEQHVAETLRRFGWNARTTPGGGDQGIDVLATKGALRVVLQCKLYGRPVGNAAVQEAIAGQRFAGAKHAAVVSNERFTRQAQQLASAAGVVLLHHDQLGELDGMLGPQRLEPAQTQAARGA